MLFNIMLSLYIIITKNQHDVTLIKYYYLKLKNMNDCLIF